MHRNVARARDYARDRCNWRPIWRTPGVGTHSYFLKLRYIRGTRKATILQLIQFQRETMVPRGGFEAAGRRYAAASLTSEAEV
jgi:hypothetical protein